MIFYLSSSHLGGARESKIFSKSAENVAVLERIEEGRLARLTDDEDIHSDECMGNKSRHQCHFVWLYQFLNIYV